MQTLKEAREKKGVKVSAIAKALGVSRPTYYKYEANQDLMTIEQAKTVCKFLSMDIDDLFFANRVNL